VTAYAIEILPLDQLRPWTRNARTHSHKQIRQIAESIRRFGFTNPVLIDGENRILAGHGRVEAARELGMATAPCLRIDHMSATDKRAYVLDSLGRTASSAATHSIPESSPISSIAKKPNWSSPIRPIMLLSTAMSAGLAKSVTGSSRWRQAK
jgi:hypothetical protein